MTEEKLLEVVAKIMASPHVQYPEALVAFMLLHQYRSSEHENHAYYHLLNFVCLAVWDCNEDCKYVAKL